MRPRTPYSRFYRSEVLVDETSLRRLREMSADGRLSADHMMIRDGRAVMAITPAEIELLRAAGFQVAVGQDLVAQGHRVRRQHARAVPRVEHHGLHTGFVTQYLDTGGILSRFAALHAEFPSMTSWTDLPHLTHGYDGSHAGAVGPATVKLFRITTTPAAQSKPGMLVIAGAHAREWIPPLAAIEFAEQLLRTYSPGSPSAVVQTVNQVVEGLDIFIIPAVNPDGINYSHHDFAMWRKNRHPNPSSAPATCDGVDNNRNYGIYWGQGGSTNDPCNDSYRGIGALSEPENRNVVHVLEQYPNILTAADCHSFGEDLFRAHPTGGVHIASEPVEPHDHAIFLELEAAMNAAISSVSPGKTYSTGTTNNHAGTCDDYLFLAHRVFGFTIECAQDFQPPIATGLVAVQEVAAALRALAERTLALAAHFIAPVNVVQVIDRSSSMTAAGYADSARSNARRMIDLMSLNDSIGLVSFNQSATTHTPLMALTHSSGYATARAAVDTIAFQGLTSIGAGVQAAGAALSGASGRKAVLLLSDGYQNRAPWVADVLPSLPAGVSVHTIALGPQSDQALLEMIADATGGSYYFSPDELELHEVYNYVRAAAAGEELVLNETVGAAEASGTTLARPVVIEDAVSAATFAVSWEGSAADLVVALRPPQGPIVDLSRVREVDGRAYKVLRVRRPQAGVWSLSLKQPPTGVRSCAIAAFVRSPLRLRLTPAVKTAIVGKPIILFAQVHDRGKSVHQLRGATDLARPVASLSTLVRDWGKRLPPVPVSLLQAPDALPKPVLQALLIRDRLRRQTNQDPLRYVREKGVVRPPSSEDLTEMSRTAALGEWTLVPPDRDPVTRVPEDSSGAVVVSHGPTLVSGTYNVRVRVEGRSEVSGWPFVRVGLRSIRVR